MSKRFSFFLVILLTAYFCLQNFHDAVAQTPEASPETSLESRCEAKFQFSGLGLSQLQILDSVVYRYHLEHLSECKLTIGLPQTMARTCRRMGEQQSTTQLGDGRERVVTDVDILCIYSYAGFFYSHPIELALLHQDRRERVAIKSAYTLEVLAPDAGLAAVLPAEMSLIAWHERLPSAIFWLLALILVIGLSFYPIYRRQRLLQAAAAAAPEPETPPLEQFYQQIAYLLELEPQSMESQKNYYDILSAALRGYIGKRFSLPALEATSHQIVGMLGDIDSPMAYRSDCRRILSDCDYVKFGLSIPSQANNLALLRDTRTLVTGLDDFASAREARLRASERAAQQGADLMQSVNSAGIDAATLLSTGAPSSTELELLQDYSPSAFNRRSTDKVPSPELSRAITPNAHTTAAGSSTGGDAKAQRP